MKKWARYDEYNWGTAEVRVKIGYRLIFISMYKISFFLIVRGHHTSQ